MVSKLMVVFGIIMADMKFRKARSDTYSVEGDNSELRHYLAPTCTQISVFLTLPAKLCSVP